MSSALRRAVIVLAFLGATAVASDTNPAKAGWYNCPQPGTTLFDPTTGNPMVTVGHAENPMGSPTQIVWAWVCVNDSVTGANSVGTAGYYYTGPSTVGYVQHSPICLNADGPSCIESHVGVAVENIVTTGPTQGAKACVHAVVETVCRDVRISE